MRSRVLAASAAFCFVAAMTGGANAGYKPEDSGDGTPRAEKPYAAPQKSRRDTRTRPFRDGYRYVYAEGWYGFKRVVAPVRRAELGDQVRLPGGAWVYCEISCEYTLRKQSLDFWQGQGAGGDSQVSPGYFRKDFSLDGLYGPRW